MYHQGLTQTFMRSGPQDHQLRGSGGPTIFLVVLTTQNVTTLASLEPTFFTLYVFSHRLYCKTTKGMTRESLRMMPACDVFSHRLFCKTLKSLRMMIDLNVNNS